MPNEPKLESLRDAFFNAKRASSSHTDEKKDNNTQETSHTGSLLKFDNHKYKPFLEFLLFNTNGILDNIFKKFSFKNNPNSNFKKIDLNDDSKVLRSFDPKFAFNNDITSSEKTFQLLSYIDDNLLNDIPKINDTKLIEDKQNKITSLYKGFEVCLLKNDKQLKIEDKKYLDQDLILNCEDLQLLDVNLKNISNDLINNNIEKRIIEDQLNDNTIKIDKLNSENEVLMKAFQDSQKDIIKLDNLFQLIHDRIEFLNGKNEIKEPSNNSSLRTDIAFLSEKNTDKKSLPLKETHNNNNKNSNRLSKIFSKTNNQLNDSFLKSTDLKIPVHKSNTKILQFSNITTNSITCLDFNKSTNLICSASHFEHHINIHNIITEEALPPLKGHKSSITCLQLSNPNIISQKLLISGSKDATINLWSLNPSSPSIVHSFLSHKDEITSLSYDSKYLITASQDKTIIQWDLKSGKVLQTLDTSFISKNQNNDTSNQIFSTYSLPIVSSLNVFDAAMMTGSVDGNLRIWDLRLGSVVRMFGYHSESITSVRYEGYYMASASEDKTVKIIDLRNGQLVNIAAFNSGVKSMDISGNTIACAVRGESVVKCFNWEEDKYWEYGDSTTTSKELTTVKMDDDLLLTGNAGGTLELWGL